MSLNSKQKLPDKEFLSGSLSPSSRNENSYLDRIISPEDTLARVAKSFDTLGITRVANQTGLDRIGIPCFAAFRPNAKTLANNQGKGLTEAAAKASAAMEAAEFAVAEKPMVSIQRATASEMLSQGCQLVDVRSLLPVGNNLPVDEKLEWVSGYNLLSRQAVFIPRDAVCIDMDNCQLDGICKNTNGLASGNNEQEAVFHGLCELIERDAGSLWSLKNKEYQFNTAIDHFTWQDEEVIGLLKRVHQAGFGISLFDQTSDIGIPCVMAIIGESETSDQSYFDLAAGYGAHPNAARAAIRAITEAAQTRITSIAGSRDDIDPSEYFEAAEHLDFLNVSPNAGRGMKEEIPLDTPLPDLLAVTVFSTLATSNAGDVFVFPLCDKRFEFSVVKVVVPFLEDREANSNWRPDLRALKVMNQL